MNGMIIKEIAEICGVDERTVQRWVVQASDKMSGLSDKMSQAVQTKKPASFTLPETLAIIRAGGRATLADLLSENADRRQATALPPPNVNYTEIATAVASAVTAAMTPLIRELRTPTRQVGSRQATLALPAATPDGEYYTIKGYGSMHGVTVNNTNAVMLGRETSRLSRQQNIDIHKIPDEKWGEVNSYHISVLKEVFTV